MEHKRFEIRISGSGGQGIITTGILLGEAATLYDNMFAVQTQSYGPEARGGASKTDVIISEKPIDYPKVIKPSLIAVLTKEAYYLYAQHAYPDTLLIADSQCFSDPDENKNLIVLPFIKTAAQQTGIALTANIVLLGFIIGISHVVSLAAGESAVVTRFAQKKPEVNAKALYCGYALAQQNPFSL